MIIFKTKLMSEIIIFVNMCLSQGWIYIMDCGILVSTKLSNLFVNV